MAEAKPQDPPEGWGVRPRPALLIVAGFFLSLAAVIGVAAIFYGVNSSGGGRARPETFPAPRLEIRQGRPADHLPPTAPRRAEPAREHAVEMAVRDLAARGDAGWAPLEPEGER